MKKIRIATFNTQHCLHFPTKTIDFAPFIDALKRYDADVVSLNEIRGKGRSDDYQEQTEILAKGAGYPYYYFGKAIDFGYINPYGNAILSRFPIKQVRTVLIPTPPPTEKAYDGYYEPRALIVATLDVDGTDVEALVIHVGLNPDEASRAVDAIMLHLPEKKGFLMGDFNMPPENPLFEKIKTKMVDLSPTPYEFTFASYNPYCKIDYIFATPDIKKISYEVKKEIVSDHFAVVADIEL